MDHEPLGSPESGNLPGPPGPNESLDHLIELYQHDFARLERDLLEKRRQYRQSLNAVPTDGPVVVSAENIFKTYKSANNPVAAVRGVDLSIRSGEMVALTGPSGSGKSTVLNLLSGLDRPDQGNITISGTCINKLSRNKMAEFRCQHIGFIFQFFYLQPFLSLARNVQVPTMFMKHNAPTKARRERDADSLIAAVDLSDRAHHLPKELSGGQMQRAAIARALINRPQLVLADEPTGNLDSHNAQEIMSLLDSIRREFGTAIVIVTHDHNVAASTDRVIELVDGRVA